MKTITIDLSSWHFRLLRFLNFGARYSDDLCEYVRGVSGALCLFLLMLTFAVGGIAGIADTLAWMVVSVMWLTFLDPSGPLWSLGAAIYLCALILTGPLWGPMLLDKVSDAVSAIPEKSRLKFADAWASFRERACFRVNYK